MLFFPPNFFYLTIRDCAFVSGKFGAFLASVPLPVVAAIYCILFAFVGTCVICVIWSDDTLKRMQSQLAKIILQSQCACICTLGQLTS